MYLCEKRCEPAARGWVEVFMPVAWADGLKLSKKCRKITTIECIRRTIFGLNFE